MHFEARLRAVAVATRPWALGSGAVRATDGAGGHGAGAPEALRVGQGRAEVTGGYWQVGLSIQRGQAAAARTLISRVR